MEGHSSVCLRQWLCRPAIIIEWIVYGHFNLDFELQRNIMLGKMRGVGDCNLYFSNLAEEIC